MAEFVAEPVGFAGLGIMGQPMAENLLRAGCPLTVYNRTRARTESLAAQGAGVASTPAELAEKARILFICIGDTGDVEELCEQILGAVRPGSLIVDASTISPEASRRLAARFRQRDVGFLDAPCSGSKAGAISATLTFMAGGDEPSFRRAEPYLRMMGKEIIHTGPQGSGLQVKLSQNLIGALICQAMIEGFVLARKAGVAPSMVLQVLEASVARVPMIAGKLPRIAARQCEPHFSLKWMHKDLGLILDSARLLEVPLPATALVHEMFGAGISMGHGEEDFSSAVHVLETMAGVEVSEDLSTNPA